MRTTRKLLALLLAVAMVFTMTAMTALATGGDDGTTTPDSAPTTPGGGTTTPDGGATAPGGGPAAPGGGTTTPDDGTTTPGGGPTAPDGGASTTPDDGAPTTPGGGTTPAGGTTTPKVSAEAQAVINLIAALPTSEEIQEAMTAGPFEVEAYKAQVSAARAAYNELTLEQQAKVMNYETLTQAEANLASLELIKPLGAGVCAIGGIEYPTLEAAVAEVKPGETATITMLTDVTVTAAVTLPNGVTLDLNGKTISGTTNNIITIAEEAVVIITDNSTNGGGKISNKKSSLEGNAVTVLDGAHLTLKNGVTLSADTSSSMSGSPLFLKNGKKTPKVIIENAKLITKSNLIRVQKSANQATIEIKDGLFDATTNKTVVRHATNSTVTIYGGTFTNWYFDDVNKLEEGKVALVDGEGVTIGNTPTSSYAQMGEKYYLISNNLYDLIKEDYVTGKTIKIVDTLSCTYPPGSYFGNPSGNPERLTLDIDEGKTLSGSMPLRIAEVTVTGSGTLAAGFFVPADQTKYEVISSSPSTGVTLYTGMVRVDNAAAFVIWNGVEYPYTSVSAAINAARTKSGSTVKLNQDYKTDTTVQTGAADFQLWTLDLNGHTYTYTGSDQAFDIRYTKKSFTLTDSSETGGGKLIVNNSEPDAVAIRCEGGSYDNNVTIKEGATVEGTILIGGTNNTLDVSGTIATGNKNIAIQTNGSSTKNSTITLHGGAEVTSKSCAIYHPGTGTLNVYKATVTGGEGFTGIEMRAGTLNVYDGAEITGGEGEPGSTPNKNGTTTNNAAIAVAQHNTKKEININIYGGTFTGGAAIYESNPQENEEDAIKLVKMNVSGGEFIGEVSSQDVTGFITGGKFSTDVKEYITDRYDQLVTNNETDTPFWVGWYTDRGAANTMGQTVYKVTYNFDGESVDVYYLTEEEAKEAIGEAGEDVETKEPVAVKPTPSGGGSGSGSYLPVILLSPSWSQTVSVVEHGTLTMSVRASGASSYQWFVDRGDGRGFVAITGATGPSLTIWPDMGDNGNRYYCRAMNGHGGVNSPYFTLCVVRSTLPPKTGDQVSVTLWVCLMALGVAGALTAWNRQKNR